VPVVCVHGPSSPAGARFSPHIAAAARPDPAPTLGVNGLGALRGEAWGAHTCSKGVRDGG